MKKIFAFIGTFALMCILFMLPSAAVRFTNSPVSMAMAGEYGDEIFTINDVEVYPYTYYNDNGAYVKELSIWIEGETSFANPEFLVYSYDNTGKHIGTEYLSVEYDEEYGEYHGYIYVHLNTASVEILPAEPGSWYNSYYYCRYANVSSADGRRVGIYDLLVPNYEDVGWYSDVTLYALDGRWIEVPYFNVSAHKAVGWYEWEDMKMIFFRDYYSDCLAKGDYEGIIAEVEDIFGDIENRYYKEELADAMLYAMDRWREEINSPLAIMGNSVFYDDEEGCNVLGIKVRNVSYKKIVAFKVQLTCYDIFGDVTEDENVYYVNSAELDLGSSDYYYWKLDSLYTDHIGNYSITQVVFEDRTSWYK